MEEAKKTQPKKLATVGVMTSPINLLQKAWGSFRADAQGLLMITLIMQLPAIATALMITFGGSAFAGPGVLLALGPVGGILFGIVSFALTILGTLALVDRIVNEKRGAIVNNFKAAKVYFWKYFGLIILVSLVVMGAFALLVIPGIYWGIATSFALFVLITEKQGGLKAITKSQWYVSGKWWPVFGRFLVLGIAVAVLGMIVGLVFSFSQGVNVLAQQILNLVVTPAIVIYLYTMFTELKQIKKTSSSTYVHKKAWPVLYLVVGIITIVALPFIIITGLSGYKNVVQSGLEEGNYGEQQIEEQLKNILDSEEFENIDFSGFENL
jgi:hypothetical protein